MASSSSAGFRLTETIPFARCAEIAIIMKITKKGPSRLGHRTPGLRWAIVGMSQLYMLSGGGGAQIISANNSDRPLIVSQALIPDTMCAINVLGFALWLTFGIQKNEWPPILPNGVYLALSAFILVMALLPRVKKQVVGGALDPAALNTERPARKARLADSEIKRLK